MLRRRLSAAALRRARNDVPSLPPPCATPLPPPHGAPPQRATQLAAMRAAALAPASPLAGCGTPSPRRLATPRALAAASPRGFAAGAATPPRPPAAPPHSPAATAATWLQALQIDAGAPARAILTALPRRGLCAETGLALRDLRVVDPSFRGQLPAVLVRRGAIVVALQHVKAIITADRVLLFDAANPAYVPWLWLKERTPESVMRRVNALQGEAVCVGHAARAAERRRRRCF
jgi:hypothetical protein